MFNVGDFVLNATNGICEIVDEVDLDMSGNKQIKSYFLLVPVGEQSARVYVPVDNADARIRSVIPREQAAELLNSIVDIEELVVPSEKERELTYKNAIRSCEPQQLVSLLKCIHRRREERLEKGKKCTAVDERYYKNAQHNLYSELSFVLDKEKKELEQYVESCLS